MIDIYSKDFDKELIKKYTEIIRLLDDEEHRILGRMESTADLSVKTYSFHTVKRLREEKERLHAYMFEHLLSEVKKKYQSLTI
jgi:hypothetical protein